MRYVIIAGTNRPESRTRKVLEFYNTLLISKGIEPGLVLLEGVDLNRRSPELEALEAGVLIPADRMIFIVPEYNGSYPGALKTVIDLLDYKRVWKGKKALLTGISTGRAGNLRGLDHLTASLQYLQVVVHPNKLPISQIHTLMDEEGHLKDEGTKRTIEQQVDEFISF
jgi:NAD(P)H-dependent FMN reductase